MLAETSKVETDLPTYGRKPARPKAEDLVRSHMQLVRKIAWHVHGRVSSAIDIEDLIQIGMIALVEAANGYEDRGHAFSTYASMRVRGAMIDHLRRHAAMSRSAMTKRREMLKAKADFEKTHGRTPSDSELAHAMGLDGASFRSLMEDTQATYQESLDEVYSEQSMWFADVEERADETGPAGDGDAGHVVQPDPGGPQRVGDDEVAALRVRAGGELGDDAAVRVVDPLARDDVRADLPVVRDDRGARVVAARLDREDHERPRRRGTPATSGTSGTSGGTGPREPGPATSSSAPGMS